MNYYFEDFTQENFRRLLGLAKEKYSFKFYNEINQESSYLLWRHDIDLSVHRAFELASIENEEGVKATYFIQLSSRFYNVFEEEIKELISKILDLGHKIGVHFDPSIYPMNTIGEMEKWIAYERDVLENLFETKIEVFSFHSPTPEALSCEDDTYAGLINTYAKRFKNEVNYCSDSDGYWRFERLEDVLREATNPKLQVLTHPGWWGKEIKKPREKITDCIEGRSRKLHFNYDQVLAELGRQNVGK